MDERISRKRFLQSLIALYAALGATSLTGCGGRQAESGSKTPHTASQIPPKRETTTTTRADRKTPVDVAVATGDSPAQNTEAAVRALGGIERFVRRGDRVVVKPNILCAREPEYAVTTNPEVIGAIVSLCVGAGAADVLVIDRPTSGVEEAYRVSGIGPAAEAAGGRVRILSDFDFVEVDIPRGTALKRWPIAKDVLRADVLINVPIAKQHSLTGLTLGLKNLMGILGGNRGRIHRDISQKLADIATIIVPQLTVLDANRILVRNGPSGGSLDDVEVTKTVVAGTDPVLVDSFTTTLFSMRPDDIGYIKRAAETGLGSTDLESSRIVKIAV